MERLARVRILKNLGVNGYGQLVIAVIQLAAVPILLNFWGTRLYGEWLILFAIPSYLSMTDLGFSQSAANDMTARVSRGDQRGVLAVFQSLFTLVSVVVIVGLAFITLLIFLLPISRWLNFSELNASSVQWVLWLLAAEVMIKLVDGVTHAGFRANREWHIHMAINYTTLLLQNCSVWLVAVAGYGPVMAAAAFLLVRF